MVGKLHILVSYGIWYGWNWYVCNARCQSWFLFKNKNINTILGYFIHLVGGSATNWKLQHNVLHHTYTNVSGMDEDLESDPLMRFSYPIKSLKSFIDFNTFMPGFCTA